MFRKLCFVLVLAPLGLAQSAPIGATPADLGTTTSVNSSSTQVEDKLRLEDVVREARRLVAY